MATTKKTSRFTAWSILIVAYFGGLSIACVQNKVPPCMDVITEYFNISMTTAGWLMSVFAVMGLATAIPAAIILNKLGPKMSGVVSLTCAALGSAIGALSTNAIMLMASRVIEGMGAGIIAIIAPMLISMWFPEEKRGLPMGVWTSWMPTGQSIMFLIAGGISTSLGWQGVWWFTMALCVAVGVLSFLRVKEPPAELSFASSEDEHISLREGLSCKPMWLVAVAGFLFNIGSFSIVTWIATYWSETFGLELLSANTWVSVVYMIEIAMCFLAGLVLNRVKSIKHADALGFALYAFMMFAAFNMTNRMFHLPFVIAFPMIESLTIAGLWMLSTQTVPSPKYIGLSAGVLSVGLNTGILTGPPLSGALIEALGWHTSGIIIAAVEIVAILVVLSIKVPKNAPAQAEPAQLSE